MIIDKNIVVNIEGIIKFDGINYIDSSISYARFYNYIRVVLNNKDFTIIDKQFFISFLNILIKKSTSFFEDEKISDEDLIKGMQYERNSLFGRYKDEEGKYFYINLRKGKRKINKTEELIIKSCLEDTEKQDYLVLLKIMSKDERVELKNILLEENKMIKKYEKEYLKELK